MPLDPHVLAMTAKVAIDGYIKAYNQANDAQVDVGDVETDEDSPEFSFDVDGGPQHGLFTVTVVQE